MIAELYIIPESFQHNNTYSAIEIENKIKQLAIDFTYINEHADRNKLYVNYDLIYVVSFYGDFLVSDFFERADELKKIIDRDVVNALLGLLQRANNRNFTSEEVIQDLLPLHDHNTCHGVIAFHRIDGVAEESQLIYGIEGWYKFRRYFLAQYPNQDFISECSIYFPNLYFHPRVNNTVVAILPDFAKSIVKHLGYLNDVFFYYRQRRFENESIKYQTLTSECNLEEPAASKDKNSAKRQLTFTFQNNRGENIDVTCYPHLRLSQSDNLGDSKHYQYRIYFHEGLQEISEHKILIGHIGVHL
ncbi:hypothetical protein EPD60_04675 [Flaviaesturariibacter flavus]|uniref:Uncharacterized protein n=1 Tax=Flaviaesturariibacter flavus TaxID=2502780 RepID=A0A4R1BJM3_9BACT|nr:hypothetical protein [Flaviaesturariibacter flavus]TCJ17489.1 hypothetical protein EPD60_04675 [Flaviaesturariibacter flavus]